MPWLINTQKNPLKGFKNFMDNVFKVDVAHSKVIGSECFFNIASSVRVLLIPISFRTKYGQLFLHAILCFFNN